MSEGEEEREWQRTAIETLQLLTAELDCLRGDVETSDVARPRVFALWRLQAQLSEIMDLPYALKVQPTLT